MKTETQTQELIKNLSLELKPFESESARTGVAFMAKWVAGSTALMILALATFSLRSDAMARLAEPRFVIESLMWLSATVVSAVIVLRSAIPGLLRKRDLMLGVVFVAIVGALISQRFFQADYAPDYYRGTCGAVALIIGFLSGLFFTAWLKPLAPTRLELTGTWMAISSGCLGGFIMQFSCPHDNPMHVLIWHGIPVAILSVAGMLLGRRALRW